MDLYLWMKSFHLIAMVAWFAGLFYLPRLFVYHVQAKSKESRATFEVMESKLLRIIMNPAMILTWIFGLSMFALNLEYLKAAGWLHAKLVLVITLSAYHMALAKYRRQLAAGQCEKSEKFFRILNEFPTVILVAAVLLAVLKPF
tara:strand:+ start:3079 stop:3510 length:432 start_codon:yes stop_codon:yes gene_type:complete